jgi:hypothetical protein
MTYTLSFEGQLVGHTDFEHAGPNPKQHFGVFRPTPFGLSVIPKLTGLLSATVALQRALDARGFEENSDPDELLAALMDLPEGQEVADIGRVISLLELRDAAGTRVSVASLAVSDLQELAALANAEPPKIRDGGSRYFISATFGRPRTGPPPRRDLPRRR